MLPRHGFISIDCGYTANQTYTDSRTGISYASDEGYIDAGLIHPVDKSNLQTDLADRYLNLCFFPSGERNCYTLRFLTPGGKYLVRAAFGYGDYDKLNKNPTFDLYFGVNYWTTVTIVSSSTAYVFEIIAVCPADFLQICLVNKGSGTPFISGLDLRSLTSDLYLEANVTQSLVLLSFFRDTVGFGPNRYHFGTNYQHIRFPDDPYDRMWQRYENVDGWTDVPNKSNGEIKNSTNDNYDAPSAVMRSASTPVNDSRMDLSWSSDSSMNVGVDPKFFLVLYFAELEAVQELRQFDVSVDKNPLASAFSPKFLLPTVLSGIVQGSNEHSVSLVATSNLALQPLISAMEIYMVRPVNESNSLDANAMMTIQDKFSVKKNWVGDPCAPISFAWNGLNCSYTTNSPPRITALNMSSSGLVGEIDASFGQLTLLQHLDLSHNSLSGSIPVFLGQVPALQFLDLSSNNLSGSIPWSLLEKTQRGLLTLRVDNNPGLCGNNTCNPIQKKRRNKTKLLQIVISVIVAVSLLVLAVFLFVIWDRRKKRPDLAHSTNTFENRRFTYKELKHITNNFNSVIGRGGFGLVYVGCLENGALVAVKMRSETSSQGNTEFLAEAQHLARVHHKNLVSLIGYCKDKKHLSLVYEYMDEGNLEDRLRGQESLNWLQRLKIALDSAHGLEYLHKSCSPPLIHRDVKTGNILLTTNLQAKLSDFGLTRAFSSEMVTHMTTRPAGTLGYLDPEYYATSHLSEKSDVYSFGVVLLVLITGQRAIITISDTERNNITIWARHGLSEGDIDSVIDPRIRGDCDINSVWKVAELALQCTQHTGRDRPTMTEVAEGISESLQLETSSRSMRCSSSGTGGSALADGEPVGALETELIGETSAR
ncbi:probable LRR receptor-like serine/threonine-protein kinase At1g05700 isoform X3 [Triticum urartu]|uniref:probable LRR receptor-like serine/threonine-protein kinase At1g05700 isoform X3 n=1 Tax=Triticum urartu TaxID=4572 RepID=UPI002042EF4C|nr:probable LRR receptor-like serine/threonine-protein kinase At1g05700 isoform X3 [Triticum urartu]